MPEQTEKPIEKKYYDHISIAKRTKQIVHFVQEHDKTAMLEQIIKNTPEQQTVVVTKSKRIADEISLYLNSKDIKATAIHGNSRTAKYEETATAFNSKEINIVITTDMILKSLNLNNIARIISFDLPNDEKHYYSRIAYVDEVGESISLVSPQEDKLFSTIEFLMKVEMQEEDVKDFLPTAYSDHDKVKSTKDKKKKPRHTKKKVKKTAKPGEE